MDASWRLCQKCANLSGTVIEVSKIKSLILIPPLHIRCSKTAANHLYFNEGPSACALKCPIQTTWSKSYRWTKRLRPCFHSHLSSDGFQQGLCNLPNEAGHNHSMRGGDGRVLLLQITWSIIDECFEAADLTRSVCPDLFGDRRWCGSALRRNRLAISLSTSTWKLAGY